MRIGQTKHNSHLVICGKLNNLATYANYNIDIWALHLCVRTANQSLRIDLILKFFLGMLSCIFFAALFRANFFVITCLISMYSWALFIVWLGSKSHGEQLDVLTCKMIRQTKKLESGACGLHVRRLEKVVDRAFMRKLARQLVLQVALYWREICYFGLVVVPFYTHYIQYKVVIYNYFFMLALIPCQI